MHFFVIQRKNLLFFSSFSHNVEFIQSITGKIEIPNKQHIPTLPQWVKWGCVNKHSELIFYNFGQFLFLNTILLCTLIAFLLGAGGLVGAILGCAVAVGNYTEYQHQDTDQGFPIECRFLHTDSVLNSLTNSFLVLPIACAKIVTYQAMRR